MVDNTQFDPQNPYALFSPDQWLNKFSTFNNAALPWPPTYGGTPTDAMGNPIQSFVNWQKANPGTTINSTPAQPGAAAPGMTGAQSMFGTPSAMNPSGNAALGMANWSAFMSPQQRQAMSQPVAAPQAAPQQSGPPNNWQAAIAALANPGPVKTPGATVPASTASAQPGSGGLHAFLQNWRPAQSGPGSGFQQSFSNALKGLGY